MSETQKILIGLAAELAGFVIIGLILGFLLRGKVEGGFKKISDSLARTFSKNLQTYLGPELIRRWDELTDTVKATFRESALSAKDLANILYTDIKMKQIKSLVKEGFPICEMGDGHRKISKLTW